MLNVFEDELFQLGIGYIAAERVKVDRLIEHFAKLMESIKYPPELEEVQGPTGPYFLPGKTLIKVREAQSRKAEIDQLADEIVRLGFPIANAKRIELMDKGCAHSKVRTASEPLKWWEQLNCPECVRAKNHEAAVFGAGWAVNELKTYGIKLRASSARRKKFGLPALSSSPQTRGTSGRD